MNPLQPSSLNDSKNIEQESQQAIQSIQKSWQKNNVWLILPEKYSAEEVLQKLNSGKNIFNGIFILENIQNSSPDNRVEFRMIDRETPLKNIKKQIATQTSIPEDLLELRFLNTRISDDKDDFFNKLNMHGLGGEIIRIRQNLDRSKTG